MIRLSHKALMAFAILSLSACNDNDRTSDNADVLVAMGNTTLTRKELHEAMPGGLNADDSTRFARAYIRHWIDTRIVREIAAKEIDMSEIESMVNQYRDELIMWEYSRQMYDSHKNVSFTEDSIRSYYDTHPQEFVLKRPMVQGIYLKVANTSKSLPVLRANYKGITEEALDKIEKSGLDGAVHYDYFLDRWVDWEQIESLVPYDYGVSADAFLRSKRSIDMEQGGFTYLLNVTKVLYTGDKMPYEAARDYIIDRLTFQDKRAYDLYLKERLYSSAVEEGKIKINCSLTD